jgi:predicted LPLAT superfamily acyltransferase
MTVPGSGDPPAQWARAGERGSRFALRFLLLCMRTFGHAPLVVVLAPIAIYFVFFSRAARDSSKDFLRRIRRSRGQGGEPGLRDVYRHIYSFAAAILDRFALWGGALDEFEITLHGRAAMEPLVEQRTGALLVGAHIGSFDVLRVIAREADIPVNVIMYSVNAERINAAFKELDPESRVRIIDLDPNSTKAAFEVRQCIERGEFVAVLADRVLPRARSRVAHAMFLGQRAPFPQGPFLLAAVLRVPVILTIALRKGPWAYDAYLELISPGGAIGRRSRASEIQRQVDLYASRLEHYCLMAPDQWFNFYDFWADVGDCSQTRVDGLAAEKYDDSSP